MGENEYTASIFTGEAREADLSQFHRMAQFTLHMSPTSAPIEADSKA
jgi:hypothetical protein